MCRAIRDAALLSVFLAITAQPAMAQSISCGLLWALGVSADSVAFGTYLPTDSSPDTSNGKVTVSCSAEIQGVYLPSFTVALSAGNAGSFSTRKMSNGGANLNYNLYTTSTYGSIWGDGSSGTRTQSYSAGSNSRSSSMTMYGRIPASQTVASGAYTDTITVTITY